MDFLNTIKLLGMRSVSNVAKLHEPITAKIRERHDTWNISAMCAKLTS